LDVAAYPPLWRAEAVAGSKVTKGEELPMDEVNAQKGKRSEGQAVTAYLLPGARLYKSLKHGWHWRRLRWAVAAASEAAQGHEANGMRPGSQEFKTLYNEIAYKVQEYSHDSGDPIDTLKAKLPALCAIERLANPEPVVLQSRLALTLGIIIAAVLGSIGIGALIGLASGMAHWIAHLFA
jgi:hypothetical protein